MAGTIKMNFSSSVLGFVFGFFTPSEHVQTFAFVCTLWRRVVPIFTSYSSDGTDLHPKGTPSSVRDLFVKSVVRQIDLEPFVNMRVLTIAFHQAECEHLASIAHRLQTLRLYRRENFAMWSAPEWAQLIRQGAFTVESFSVDGKHHWIRALRRVTLSKIRSVEVFRFEGDLTLLVPFYEAVCRLPCRLFFLHCKLPVTATLPRTRYLYVKLNRQDRLSWKFLDQMGPSVELNLGRCWHNLRTIHKPAFAGAVHFCALFTPKTLNCIMRCLLRARDLETLVLRPKERRDSVNDAIQHQFLKFFVKLKAANPRLSTLVLVDWSLYLRNSQRTLGLTVVRMTGQSYDAQMRQTDGPVCSRQQCEDLTHKFLSLLP